MIRSMTGFGSASTEESGAHLVVEIRSLNNRYFKCQVRLPEELAGIEPELETRLARRFARGSVVVAVRFADTTDQAAATINTRVVQRYLDQLMSVPAIESAAATIDVAALLALPGVVMANGDARLDRVRPVFMKLVDEACDRLFDMRAREGERLHTELHRHREIIGSRLSVIASRAPRVVDEYQARLKTRVESLLAEVGSTVKDEDLVREVAIYAERSDIAEEVVRLQAHLEQFADIINSDDDEPAGRTLDFLSQEMLREANTIASKSSDAEISREIVEIKGAIDRIKEQVQNVE